MTAPADLVEVRLAAAEDMPAVYALRHEVFVIGQDVPVELERDDLDDTAVHAVALLGDRVIGTGRLVRGRIDEVNRLEPVEGLGTIGRMAVHPASRGTGVGRQLLDLLVDQARSTGLRQVELHAQLHARGFYDRAGFAPFGDVYLEAGIEHLGMRREL
jgi:predicted GNAT family N-acyltransferase